MVLPHPHIFRPLCRRPLFFETPFCMVFWKGKRTPKWCPQGRPKSLKITKNRKKRVPKGRLNSRPQKTLKILDFGSPWDLQNRAETQARASFSLIRLITKKCSTFIQKHTKCLCFFCHCFLLFVILVSPGPPKQELFEAIWSIFSCLGELVKTTLSPESQHDSAGPRGSQNLIFSVFFEVSSLSGLLGPSFFDFL